jgi:acyl carrier protein
MDTLKAMDTLKVILTDLGIPEELLHKDALLREDLQLDSAETVEISLGLKRKLGVNVKLEGRQDITLAQVCTMVEMAMPSASMGSKQSA